MLWMAARQSWAQSIGVLDYFPNTAGDSLFFKDVVNPNAKPIVIKFTDWVVYKDKTLLKRVETTGDFRLESLDSTGLWVHVFFLADSSEFTLDRPLQLIPAKISYGETYRDEVKFTLFKNGRKMTTGTIKYSVNAEGKVASRTFAQNFDDCLVLHTTFERILANGSKMGYKYKEYLANGVGLVKVAGDYYRTPLRALKLESAKIAIMLERGVVGGKVIKNPKE